MILGIGIDLCKISRITQIKSYENFSTRILTQIELKQYNNLNEQAQHNFLAKRWAIKEAFAKATGLGLSKIGWQNIEITNDNNGKPVLNLNQEIQTKLITHFNKNFTVHISTSDEEEYASAVAIIEALETNER